MAEERALTIQEPWALAAADGVKWVENRSRPLSYRGRVWVHAGGRWSDRGATDERIAAWWGRRRGLPVPCHPAPHRDLLPTGVLLGSVQLVDSHPAGGCCAPWGDAEYDGKPVHHLVLEDARLLPVPVPVAGRLGLWRVPAAVAAEALAQLARAVASDSSADLGLLPPIHPPGTVREALDQAAQAVHHDHDPYDPGLCRDPRCRSVQAVYEVAFGAAPKQGGIRL